jgi:hypothetical protein
VYDIGCLRVEKDFPEQKSFLSYKKKRNQGLSEEEKGSITKFILKKE